MKMTIITTFFLTLIYTSTAQPLSLTKSEIDRYHTRLIARMISVIQPDISSKHRDRIARKLHFTTRKYRIDPKLMIAIIGTESEFQNSKVSPTGDLSMAQINPEIWNKEFERMGLHTLNPRLLKKDEAYALSKMAEILNIIKARHGKKDKHWYARYHSHTKKYKEIYSLKIEKKMRMIASIN